MAYGSDVHNQIGNLVREFERKYTAMNTRLAEQENAIASLNEAVNDGFVELAKLYLPDLEATLNGDLVNLNGDRQRIYNQKQAKRIELEKGTDSSAETKAKYEQERTDISSKINETSNKREEVRAAIAAELLANPEYLARRDATEKAQANLDQEKSRLIEMQGSAIKALKAFDNNQDFKYLLDRNYGTPAAKGNWFTKKRDQKIATQKTEQKEGDNVIIGEFWAMNKPRYDYLKAVPILMRAEVERRQMLLDEAVMKLAEVENDASEKQGLPEVINTGNELLSRKDELTSLIDGETARYSRMAEDRAKLDTEKDDYLHAARDKIEEYMKGQTITRLREMAANTSDQKDDGIVARIDGFIGRLSEGKANADAIKKEQSTIYESIQKLQKIENWFRVNDFENSMSRFDDGFDVNNLLLGYLLGRHSENHVHSSIHSNHHLKPVETYHSSTNYTSTYHSGGGGGGIGGGSFGGGSSGHSGGRF